MEQVVVETAGWVRTDGEAETVEVHLSYDPVDPLAVTVRVTGPDRSHLWVLGRDLLADGLRSTTPHGEGAVRVQATSVLTELQVDIPGGPPVVLRLPWWNAREFVRRTLAAVPRGQEECDVDAWLAALMGTHDT